MLALTQKPKKPQIKPQTKPYTELHVKELHVKEPYVLILKPTKDMNSKYIVPAKRVKVKAKQIKVPKAVLKASLLPLFKAKKSVKSLKLALVGAALF